MASPFRTSLPTFSSGGQHPQAQPEPQDRRGGVLERHPRLHVVLVEVNTGWLAWTMHTADEYYLAHALWSAPKLAELPSHYLRSQLHATFQRDPVGVANRAMTGVECLMWGGDYPHPETTYPHSRRVLRELLADVVDDDAAAIVGGTAARIFGFSTAALGALPTGREAS